MSMYPKPAWKLLLRNAVVAFQTIFPGEILSDTSRKFSAESTYTLNRGNAISPLMAYINDSQIFFHGADLLVLETFRFFRITQNFTIFTYFWSSKIGRRRKEGSRFVLILYVVYIFNILLQHPECPNATPILEKTN